MLPRILGPFRRAYPEVVLDLESMTTIRQTEALRDGRIDVGLLRPAPAGGTDAVQLGPRLTSRVVSADPLVVALPARHRLARRKRVRLADLAEETFVLYSRPSGPAVHDTIVGFCRSAGFSPRIEQEAADVQTIVSLVAAGLGVSLLITPRRRPTRTSVVYRELSDDLPPWQLSVAWSPDNHSPVLARFLEAV